MHRLLQLTRGMCCPTSDGGAAVVVASEDFVHKHGLENQAVEIVAMSLTTDTTVLLDKRSHIELTGVSHHAAFYASRTLILPES